MTVIRHSVESAPDFRRDELSPGMVEVVVDGAENVETALNKAIQLVTPAAIRHKTGIMVSRTGSDHYVVRAHPSVPFGLVRQR